MKSAADKLKQFKTRLGRDYIWPFYEVDDEQMVKPPSKYKFITQVIWDEFVKSRLSDEFKVCNSIFFWANGFMMFCHLLLST